MGKIELTRRKFLIASTSLIAAPAIVRIASLMPVRVHDIGWDPDKWHHVVFSHDGSETYTYVDGVHITRGIARYSGIFTPPDVSYPDWTFETWLRDKKPDSIEPYGVNVSNVRLTKGDRYGLYNKSS